MDYQRVSENDEGPGVAPNTPSSGGRNSSGGLEPLGSNKPSTNNQRPPKKGTMRREEEGLDGVARRPDGNEHASMDQDSESDVSGFILNGPGKDHPLEVALQQIFDQGNSGENHHLGESAMTTNSTCLSQNAGPKGFLGLGKKDPFGSLVKKHNDNTSLFSPLIDDDPPPGHEEAVARKKSPPRKKSPLNLWRNSFLKAKNNQLPSKDKPSITNNHRQRVIHSNHHQRNHPPTTNDPTVNNNNEGVPPVQVRTPIDPPARVAFAQPYHQQEHPAAPPQQHPPPPPQFHPPPPPQHPVAPPQQHPAPPPQQHPPQPPPQFHLPPPPQHPVAPPPQLNNNIPPNDLQDTIRYYENHVVLPKELLCIVSGSLPYVAGSEFSENPLKNQLNRRERRHLKPRAKDVRNEVKRRRGILNGRRIQRVWYQYMDMKQGMEWLKDRENSVLSPLEVTYFTEELRDMFDTNGIDLDRARQPRSFPPMVGKFFSNAFKKFRTWLGSTLSIPCPCIDVAVATHRPREQPQQDEDGPPELTDE